MQHNERLARLLLAYITTNILAENLPNDLHGGLFKQGTKNTAKHFLEYLENDIKMLYSKGLQKEEAIEGYTKIFNLIDECTKEITKEFINNTKV